MDKSFTEGLPIPQRYGAILTIIIGIAMAVLDGVITNVALPTIASDLHVSPASSIWVVNAYQIAIVISLLSFAFLGDMFGRYSFRHSLFLSLHCSFRYSFVSLRMLLYQPAFADS